MQQQLFQHIDGIRPKAGHDSLVRLLQEKGILDPLKDKDKPAFCGLVCLDNEIHFFWPKTSQIFEDKKDIIRCGRKLLKVLKKYSLDPADNEAGESTAAISGVPPIAALDILQDYLGHGIYTNTRSHIVRKNTGNIVWNKVIKQSMPLPDHEGRPVYTDLYVRKQDYFSENEISSIHEAILAQLDLAFGWYFSDDGIIAPELTGSVMPCPDSKAISLLKKEMAGIFSDREIRLLKNLISFLEHKNVGTQENLLFTGIQNFEYIWEKMCKSLYGDQEDEFKAKIPVPAYVINGKIEVYERNRQRMDIIIKENKRIAVLDAKYYDLSSTKPLWGDLVKQFYYARSLAAIMPGCSISNHFICPLPTAQEALPTLAVIQDPSSEVRMDTEFMPINITYHSISDVMESYLEGVLSSASRNQVLPAAI